MNSQRVVLKYCLALLGALLFLPTSGCHPSARELRGVMLISIDTLRADHLSCYGYERETSPHLDAFAEDAALFQNAYAQAPFTLTSHMSIFTSLFPLSHGVERERKLSDRVPLITEILKETGYTTIGFQNADWLAPGFGFGRGFDRYERHHGGEESRDKAVSVLADIAATDTPFFFFLHLMDVHCGSLESGGTPLYNSPPNYRDFFLPHPELDTPRHPKREIWEDRVDVTREERENIVAQYDGGILYADRIVGQVLDRMKELGLYEPTLIIVTSDHGESLGNHGTFKGHGLLWENGLRVPLLVKLPGSHPKRKAWRGKRILYRVQSVDIAPTILSMAGLPAPPWFQGQSLLIAGERVVVAQRMPQGKSLATAMLDGRHKLVGESKKWQLFDLVADPEEVRPVHTERTDLVRKMRRKLRMLTREFRNTRRSLAQEQGEMSVRLDDASRQRLEALGYLK